MIEDNSYIQLISQYHDAITLYEDPALSTTSPFNSKTRRKTPMSCRMLRTKIHSEIFQFAIIGYFENGQIPKGERKSKNLNSCTAVKGSEITLPKLRAITYFDIAKQRKVLTHRVTVKPIIQLIYDVNRDDRQKINRTCPKPPRSSQLAEGKYLTNEGTISSDEI